MECQFGCFLTGSGGSAWDSWLKGAFQSALAAAPLDMAEAWATAVRFVVNALAYTNPAGMHAVLQVIVQQPPQGKLLCSATDNALAYTNPAGMHAVLQVIIQQPPQDKLLFSAAAHTCVCWSVGRTGLLRQQCGIVYAAESTVVRRMRTINLALRVISICIASSTR